MNDELKPCPFCGGKASTQRFGNRDGGAAYAVWCNSCHISTGWMHGDQDASRAIAAWNRRATPPSPSTAPTASANGGLLEHAKVAETRMDTGFGGGHLASARSASAPIAEDELRAAAAEVLKRWDTPLWRQEVGTAALMNRLRAALSSHPAGEVEELRALVEEWLCESCNTVYPGPPARGFACVICPKCGGSTGPRMLMENRKLRAALALRTAGEVELPPLPKEVGRVASEYVGCGIRCGVASWTASAPKDDVDLFTADQLRAYGQECARAALGTTGKDAERLLTAIMQSDVGIATRHKLEDGQGVNTDDGKIWLAAIKFVADLASNPETQAAKERE